MPRYSSTERQKAEAMRHRQEILEAAVGVFAGRGFADTTMQDIAGAAKFSVGKLYLHFPSKDALYRELLESLLGLLLDRLEAELDRPYPVMERIAGAVRAQLEFFHDNPLLLRLLVSETLGFELRLQAQLGKDVFALYRRFQGRLVCTFQEGIDAGDYCGFSATELTLKLSGILNSVLTAHVIEKSGKNPAELAELVLRLFTESPVPPSRVRVPVKVSSKQRKRRHAS